MTRAAKLKANWIWKKQDSYHPYHQTILAKKTFRMESAARGTIKVTCDGGYRLAINGRWVNDGPGRSWPEHFQYDAIDVTNYLNEGENTIAITARHWSVGNFHTVPRQAGLLAQLELEFENGRRRVIGTDQSWMAAEARAWIANTPKVSIQMEPQEVYDARLEDELAFEPAAVLYKAEEGPWQYLHERDSALLTRKPLALRAFREANLVARVNTADFCSPTARLANPGLIEANHSVSQAGGMVTVLELEQDADLQVEEAGFRAAIDGTMSSDGIYRLKAGRHLLLAFSYRLFGHDKDRSLRLVDPPGGMQLTNPLDETNENPWCRIDLPAFQFQGNDLDWPYNQDQDGERERSGDAYLVETDRLLRAVRSQADLQKELAGNLRNLPVEEMFSLDTHAAFLGRRVLGSAAGLVENPTGMMYDGGGVTILQPSPEGDIELIYDLGEQSVGYYDLELAAEAGVEVDLYGVEYITPEGVVQHSWGNRNGMRYITRAGANRFTSLKRRSQRYLFITLRQQTRPVRFQKLQLIESTYPVQASGWFECSDARLGKIYEISARTLKLCMEDTFTDCPLYEQTLWVGDARNEAVFNFATFGAEDIVRRCIRLTAQSLERYPLAGCQVPSGWDTLIPVWSFLWGISVWDYYEYSGDRGFLEETWAVVTRNLRGAEGKLDENGLFRGNYWNMFDWSGTDDRHEVVLHNSMFLCGAIDAALKIAEVLHKRNEARWLRGLRKRLHASLNRFWDPSQKAWPDSIHKDGTISESRSIHTSILALLYDIATRGNQKAALKNMLRPPEGMVGLGSPFAILYLYEALDKAGLEDEILKSIYANYLPMLEDGATTVWEVFPASNDRPGGFPTRSHCHAWSSAPLAFLPKVVLGIRASGTGGESYEISPRVNGLSWAKGAIPSPRGAVEVSWKVEEGKLSVRARAPEGTAIHFTANPTMEGLEVIQDLGN